VLASVQIPIVIVTRDLRIRSFTPAAAPLFNLISSDVGRPLSGVGVGASVLDGLIRGDLSRGLYPSRKIRFDLYVEARF